MLLAALLPVFGVIAELVLRLAWPLPPAFAAFAAAACYREPEPGSFEPLPEVVRTVRVALPLDPPPPPGAAPAELVMSTNRQGLRGPELQPKRDRERRLLFGGDSLTFGLGLTVEQAFPHATAALLCERGLQVSAANAAVPGHGFDTACRRVRQWTARAEADAVVVAYFLGNDFVDDIEYRTSIVLGGRLFAGPIGNLLRNSWRGRLCAYSRLALFCELWAIDRQWSGSLQHRFVATEEQVMLHACLPQPTELGGLYLDAPVDFAFRAGGQPLVPVWLQVVERSLRELQTGVGSVPIVVVILPTRFHLDPQMRLANLAAMGLDPARMPAGNAQRHLAELCQRLGVACVDATRAFAAAGTPASLFDQDHIHLSVKGSRVVATALADHFEPRFRR